jgi:hypothetical protein
MHSNAFFTIGSSHDVCQDYARAGVTRRGRGGTKARCFAVVSDGCSSSVHSDLGARLLTCAAMHSLEVYGDVLDSEWMIGRAASAADQLGIDRGCLDATLLAAWEGEDGNVNVWAAGDGVVAAKRHDGRIETWTIDDSGAPAYLSYLLKESRLRQYLREGYGSRKITHTFEGRETPMYSSSGFTPWTLALNAEEYEFVLILSDGVESFQCDSERPGEQLESAPILEHLMALKSTRGEFLVRRCRRFLQRYCVQNQWKHVDDFGVAGIYLGDTR